ncbi:NAD(P)-binding protein [Schizophyllum commune Tattone D]|nr:NAD(P)-binding protein [Schizophyllum commune Loenen D]KAI5832419.1 NAD(P)-binding protein [Schizophyllum commune Tattone D]
MSDPRRVALVTGASQGLGKAIALRLAKDGLHVGLNDIPLKTEALKEVASLVEQHGVRSAVFPGDVTQENDVKAMIDGTADALGGFDVMVANAGILIPAPFLEETVSDFNRVTNVNTTGCFLCYQYAGRRMIEKGHRQGRIIGASSHSGKRPATGQTSYVATKYAVRGLTSCTALNLGPHGITVNAYAPGMMETTMVTESGMDAIGGHTLEKWANQVPMRRHGTPEDVANLVSFLAKEETSYITGQTISVDGGAAMD